jgi:hypothetical protein
MSASSHHVTAKKLIPEWMLWTAYVAGFTITLWALQYAEITMVVAHGQWEIREEIALRIALYIWVPIVASTWVALRFLRCRKRRSSRAGEEKSQAEQLMGVNRP